MGFLKLLKKTALLGAVAQAQLATFNQNGAAISVNIPADTASGSSQTIYFQISAPSGTQWVGFGQGGSMSGSNMFVVYAADSTNVTVSPRSGRGEQQPDFNSAAQISVLEGTGIDKNGGLVANVRCDNCLNWSGGNMDPKSTSSSWIWAIKSGSPLNTASTSTNFLQHDTMGGLTLDLTQGTGGSSSNPFLSSSSTSGGASPSGSSASNPVASSSPNSGSSSSSSSSTSNTTQVRTAHAIVMSLVFLILFPAAALTLYLPYAQKVRHIHAPLQLMALILTIVGLALGVALGKSTELDAYHQVIGYIIVAILILFQPALGIIQHLHYHKTGGRSPMGVVHRWLGRTMILLGVVNGGLGFKTSGPVGNSDVPSYSVVAYSIVAGVVFLVYLSIVLAMSFKAKKPQQERVGEKLRPADRERGGYQMQTSPVRANPQQKQHPPKRANNQTYTISNPNPGYEYGQGQTYR